jgi:hypothetical protein
VITWLFHLWKRLGNCVAIKHQTRREHGGRNFDAVQRRRDFSFEGAAVPAGLARQQCRNHHRVPDPEAHLNIAHSDFSGAVNQPAASAASHITDVSMYV